MKRKPTKALVDLDPGVTLERVSAFANSDQAAQLRTLNILRRRASPILADLVSITALCLAIVFGLFSMTLAGLTRAAYVAPTILPIYPTIDRAAVSYWLMVGVLGATPLVVLSTLVTFRKAARLRRNAIVLLAAYESELRRRETARGMAARKWRRERPINWG